MQPNWTDSPPDVSNVPGLQLRRIKTTAMRGVCLTPKPIGCEVHYWRGRTRPHPKDGPCEACADGNNPRWRGYIAMWDPNDRIAWITEITPRAYQGLQEGLNSFGTLRGHHLKLERTRQATNAPLEATVYATIMREEEMPHEPDLRKILANMWDLTHSSQHIDPTTTRGQIDFAHVKRNGPIEKPQPKPV